MQKEFLLLSVCVHLLFSMWQVSLHSVTMTELRYCNTEVAEIMI